jgi:DNA-directed RNA polymerase specialized sigma24 family protein
MLRLWKSEVYSHEDVVIQRYDWLMNWSLKLTGHNREEAEDLVQDAFVEFTLSAPDLASIQNLEGYLYGMLRNIYISRVRRSSRIDKHTVNLLDYDSAEIWLRSVHIDSLIHARELLRRVCRYACERKETSKAGSILILRFFHGYYPGEIARIALCTRRAVDDWMLIARKEARKLVEQTIVEGPAAAVSESSGCSGNDFLDSLRRTIFDSKKGRCLSQAEIEDRYNSEGQQPAIDRKLLAHISSCPACLERINQSLNLPPLSDRFPTDMLGNDVGDAQARQRGRPAAASRLRAWRRLARSVYEHEPRELSIMVNGFFAGSGTVSSGLAEQTLVINTGERISVIEAFSEQGLRVLGLHVEPPTDGPLYQSARVELSEGRSLELSVAFRGLCPSLKSSYHDPRRPEPTLLGRASRVLRPVSRPSPFRPSDLSSRSKPPLPTNRPRIEKVPRGRSLIRAALQVLAPRLRPATVTAAISILLAAIIIVLQIRTTPVSAAELLRQAVAADEKTARQSGTAIHRRLLLEERNLAPPVFVTRRQLDVWASPAAGLKGCRVYDENGLLIAGEWVNSTGAHSVYRRDTSTPLQDDGDVQLARIIESGELWRIGLSVKDFLGLVGRSHAGSVIQGPSSYTINYDFGQASSGQVFSEQAPMLVRASLALNKAGLQAFEETLVLRRPQGLIQYRFTEKSQESVPLSEARPSVFDPDPWIPGAASKAPPPVASPGAESGSTPAASTEPALGILKLQAIYKLHQAGLCLGGQTTFTTTQSGKLAVQVLTEGDRAKAEAIAVLDSVARNPRVELSVNTFQEAAARRPQLPSGSLIVRNIEVDRDRIPAYADLKRHFSTATGLAEHGPNDQSSETAADHRIERFSASILKRSRNAVLHVWALKHHADEAPGSLGDADRSLLEGMIADHLKAIHSETAGLAAELGPIFRPAVPAESEDHTGLADPAGSIDGLYERVRFNEDAITTSFTVSGSGEPSACPIKTAQFWRSLGGAERLAASMLKRGG